MVDKSWPRLIQGGMGVAISNWRLARAVSLAGGLGVVSGTGIDTVLVRRLQDGDEDGHIRQALAESPWPVLARDITARYFRPEGRGPGEPYVRLPTWNANIRSRRAALAMMGGFVECWLAKRGHAGRVGVNLLTKAPLPNLPVLYGAMSAGIDVVLMGAGIPREIPEALDRMADHQAAALRGEGVGRTRFDIVFDPAWNGPAQAAPLQRPPFFPVIGAHSLALLMDRKTPGGVEGFVVETAQSGGHSAPPRGAKHLNADGEPIYGPRDDVDWQVMRDLGKPFYIAGGYGSKRGLADALARGAQGVQVGTLFAYCEESGMAPPLRERVLAAVRSGSVKVRTDANASPTGFPFKVIGVAGTLSEPAVYAARPRRCDLGYLREAYTDSKERLRFRCAAEPVPVYVAKGGRAEDTVGRKCLCNGLMATAGFAQRIQNGEVEPPILTSGDAIHETRNLMTRHHTAYTARDVVQYVLGGGGAGVLAEATRPGACP